MNLNFHATNEKNVARILKDTCVFGIYWLNNGTTIKQTPLLNIKKMCGIFPPNAMSIFDCMDHISAGGKKVCATFPWAMCFHGDKHVLSLLI